jgi:hypothetical protein
MRFKQFAWLLGVLPQQGHEELFDHRAVINYVVVQRLLLAGDVMVLCYRTWRSILKVGFQGLRYQVPGTSVFQVLAVFRFLNFAIL